MKVSILRKQDNKKIRYENINHITFGTLTFGLHRWCHLQNIKIDWSKFFDFEKYSIINVVDDIDRRDTK